MQQNSRRDKRSRASDWMLVSPAALAYLLLLVAPLLFLARTSLLPPGPGAPLSGEAGLSSYTQLADGYYALILGRTLRIAFATTLFCLLLGYPLALHIVSLRHGWRRLAMLAVLSPLFVSVVVRSYGWVLLLGNRGLVNGILLKLRWIEEPLRLLYTEGAVVVALVEALLPFMTLSIVAVLDRLPGDLSEAARGLGATPSATFLNVTLPLSFPGAFSGALLVFMVSMGSYATPALVGGSRIRVVVTEIVTQVTTVFNWPLAAALAIVLLMVSLVLVAVAERLARGRVSRAEGRP